MRRCAFLTLTEPVGFVIDDERAYGPLSKLGWRVEAVPWNRPGVAWRRYDLVVIRSTWDYYRDPEAYLAVLAEIERLGVPLQNPLPLVRWNLHKTYLRDLAARGVPIVPTVWRDRLGPGDLEGLFREIGSDEAVVKPAVGASAVGAFRLDRRSLRDRAGEAEAYYASRALVAQPFVHAVLEEGEYSLFYFNGEHSHTVLKTPKTGDFRVQEEHGATVRPVDADAGLLAAGREALEAVGEVPLYLRVDFVRANDGASYWLMELELVEPSLYLRMDPKAPARFARAIDARMAAVGPTGRA